MITLGKVRDHLLFAFLKVNNGMRDEEPMDTAGSSDSRRFEIPMIFVRSLGGVVFVTSSRLVDVLVYAV